jgi:CRP-like cAMP-binding protein
MDKMATKALTSHDVFSFLQPEQVNAVSEVAEVHAFGAGETVFNRGERADSMYAVLEGEVRLQLPREGGVSLHIEDLQKGALFGSCVCFDLSEYSLTAVCTQNTELLKISALGLKRVMEDDLAVGYPVQRMISRTYFRRYLDTMQKLKTVAEALSIKGN